mmetsp:Transcript_71644/g.232955  ORF Transcript_71644/g.232955 Transcript_71644/m.232955 type:complete len:213 (+) Transcript_71644:84-722(+)
MGTKTDGHYLYSRLVSGDRQLAAEHAGALGALRADILRKFAGAELGEQPVVVREERAVHIKVRAAAALALRDRVAQDRGVREHIHGDKGGGLHLRQHLHHVVAGLALGGVRRALHKEDHLVRLELRVQVVADDLLVGLVLLHRLGHDVLVELARGRQGIRCEVPRERSPRSSGRWAAQGDGGAAGGVAEHGARGCAVQEGVDVEDALSCPGS